MAYRFTYGTTPEGLISTLCRAQCPDGYPMTIRSKREWAAISEAVNQGIDSHLTAIVNSKFDANTGECVVHSDDLPVLLRRMGEGEAEEGVLLRIDILSTLGVEEI